MSRIAELWLAGTLPVRDGLYRVDGSARSAEVDGPALSWFDLGPPLDLDAILADDPDYVTDLDISAQAELPDGSGYVCCGEGALGSEGFFARLDPGMNLIWVVSLGDSNPFRRVIVNGSHVTFINNLENELTLDLASPDYA